MSRLFKRLILTSCVFIMMITSCFMFGSAAWYFFSNISTSTSATDVADNLRPNQLFGDGQDTAILDTKFYDVYFLAQNVQDIPDPTNEKTYVDDTTFFKKIGEIENSDGKFVNNYTFKEPVNKQLYYDDSNTPYTYKYGNDLRQGVWESRASVSPYYWKWTNVNTVSASMLSSMGNPYCEMVDTNGWPLTFNSWIVNPYNIYVKKNNHGEYTKDNINYIQVYGSYPFQNFETAYFNSLLSIYDSHAIYIDGHLSLFFYPIYSSGKGYYAYNADGARSEYLRDSIAIINRDENTQAHATMQKEEFFIYSPTYTDLMLTYQNGTLFKEEGERNDTNKTRYRAYRFTEYIVNSADVSQTRGFIQNDMDLNNRCWPGTKSVLTRTVDNTSNPIYLNKAAGRYNFYLFVKERYVEGYNLTATKKDAEFSEEQKNAIYKFFDRDDLHIYRILNCDTHEYIESSYYYDSRDYILIVEKKYEPRIVGYKTGGVSWLNPNSRNLFFTKNGITKDTMDSYTLRDIQFDCEDYGYIEYTISSTGRKIRIPDYYFGVQISRDTHLIYNEDVGYEHEYNYDSSNPSATPPYDVPLYKYLDVDNTIRTDPYMSHELLITLQNAIADDLTKADQNEPLIYHDIDRILLTETNATTDSKYYTLREYKNAGFTDYDAIMQNFVLIRPIESGIYNLFAHIKYGTDADITVYDIPEALGIWAYRKHNTFVNIYDPSDFGGKTISFDGTYIDEGMLNNYSFRCDSYYHLNTDFMYEEDGTYKRFNRMSGLPNKEGLNKDPLTDLYDILSILQYYDQDNKCLQDIVSGRYITLENYSKNPFIVRKNYVFQVVTNPFKGK